MASEEGLAELRKELDELAKRVNSGEIPKTAMPRFFHIGHELVNSYTGYEWFKCSCGHKWMITEAQYITDWRKDKTTQYPCPVCNKIAPVKEIHWYHDNNPDAKWRCIKCKHEWISPDGEVCPECKTHHKDCGKNG